MLDELNHPMGPGNGPEPRVGVIIADDNADLLEALLLRLRNEPGIEVLGTATDAGGAALLAERVRPDVALIDVQMPGGGGAHATREIRVRSPRTRVVALTAHDDRETVLQMVRAGASSYLTKSVSGPEVVHAIRRAFHGEGTLSGGVAAEVMGELAAQLERRDLEERERAERASRIRSVLAGTTDLRMVFQPISELATGRVNGLEALARFDGAANGGPQHWFAEAQTVGLRLELEMLAVSAALAEFDRAPTDAYLSLNVSPETVASPSLFDSMNGVDWERIVLEITEHAPVEDYAELGTALDEVRRRGARLAVDDAGAGFASLQHILQLKPDYIKLDISLTRGVDTEPGKNALAQALIAFAPQVGATIIAEGVETAAQLEALRRLGVRHGQGFFLARPGPLALTA